MWTARSTSSSTRARSTRSERPCSRPFATLTRRAGRALAPIDPAEYVNGVQLFIVGQGRRTPRSSDAMLLEELGVAEPEHLAVASSESRSVGPAQVLRPLDAGAWDLPPRARLRRSRRCPAGRRPRRRGRSAPRAAEVEAPRSLLSKIRRAARPREHGLRGEDSALGRARPRRPSAPTSTPGADDAGRSPHARPRRTAVDLARSTRAFGHVRQAARIPGRTRPDLVPASKVSLPALLPGARRSPRPRRSHARDRRHRRELAVAVVDRRDAPRPLSSSGRRRAGRDRRGGDERSRRAAARSGCSTWVRERRAHRSSRRPLALRRPQAPPRPPCGCSRPLPDTRRPSAA